MRGHLFLWGDLRGTPFWGNENPFTASTRFRGYVFVLGGNLNQLIKMGGCRRVIPACPRSKSELPHLKREVIAGRYLLALGTNLNQVIKIGVIAG